MVPRPPSRFKISYWVRPENGSNGLPDIINCYRAHPVKGWRPAELRERERGRGKGRSISYITFKALLYRN